MHSAESIARSYDRKLTLSAIEGEKPATTSGALDARLFTGEQQLKVKMDPQTSLWYFQYSNNGVIPGGLRGMFTGSNAAIRHAENYFKKRNVKIVRVD